MLLITTPQAALAVSDCEFNARGTLFLFTTDQSTPQTTSTTGTYNCTSLRQGVDFNANGSDPALTVSSDSGLDLFGDGNNNFTSTGTALRIINLGTGKTTAGVVGDIVAGNTGVFMQTSGDRADFGLSGPFNTGTGIAVSDLTAGRRGILVNSSAVATFVTVGGNITVNGGTDSIGVEMFAGRPATITAGVDPISSISVDGTIISSGAGVYLDSRQSATAETSVDVSGSITAEGSGVGIFMTEGEIAAIFFNRRDGHVEHRHCGRCYGAGRRERFLRTHQGFDVDRRANGHQRRL